jgi:TRAP-type C4-dicarboxylate transport system substrate-binding protein
MKPVKTLSIMTASAVRRASFGLAAASALMLSFAASAEPVTLKMAFLTSDRSQVYMSIAKPFVDEINRRGYDILKIEGQFGGVLARAPDQQVQLVVDGKADIVFVVPSLTPDRFPDNTVIELPGLFRDSREASLVYTRLVAANALRGYEGFVVLAAVATQTETIHSRKPIASLADIKGQRLRVNNDTLGAFVTKLGATPAAMSLNFTAGEISSGKLDGALLQLAQLTDFGIGRLVTNHYLLDTGSVPLLLMMNRKVFDSLSETAKKLIRDYTGEWLANRYAEAAETFGRQALEGLKAEPRRTVVVPSPADLSESARVANIVAEEWAAESPRNRELLTRVRAEIAKIRSAK